MYEKFIAERISILRAYKNVSAREMSLAIGQNESYINRIENGHALPSMQCFFYICEYLGVTPEEFFNVQDPNPIQYRESIQQLQTLDPEQLNTIQSFIENLKMLRQNITR